MFDQKEPEFNFSGINNIINKIRKFIPFPKNNSFFSFVILIALLGLWLASGFFTVQPGEQALRRRQPAVRRHGQVGHGLLPWAGGLP